MDKTILNKEVTIQDGIVVIKEEAIFNYTKEQIEGQLIAAQRRKSRLVEENKRILAEYDSVVAEEAELQGYLASLTEPEDDTVPEPIE